MTDIHLSNFLKLFNLTNSSSIQRSKVYSQLSTSDVRVNWPHPKYTSTSLQKGVNFNRWTSPKIEFWAAVKLHRFVLCKYTTYFINTNINNQTTINK